MAKNSNYTISEKAQSIIKAINPNNNWGKYNWIIGSLYAMKEDADPEIVRVLKVDVDRFSAEVSSEDVAVLRNEYAGVIRYCYDKAKNAQLKIYHDERAWEVPSDIVEFCKKAIDPKPEDYTYIPFAGRCEFGLAFDGRCSGYEVSLYDWEFDKILIDAFGAYVDLIHSESYCVRPHSAERYDNIVSVPPFMSTTKGTPEKLMAEYFRSLLEEHLKEGGDMCLILPLSATNSEAWKSFREYLINNSQSYLTVVISLPAIFSPETSAKCCMFLIEKKENPAADLIVFEADGNDFQYAKEPNALGVSLKTETMLETLRIQDERFVKFIPSEVIGLKGSLCSVTPSRFFLEKEFPILKDGQKLIPLGNLISLEEVFQTGLTPDDLNPNGTELYVRFSCLSDNYLSCIVDPAKIEPAPARYDGIITEEPGYYAAFLNGVFRVGFIPQRANNNKSWLLDDSIPTYIGIDKGVFHFRFNPGGPALSNYLLREIMSSYVSAQAIRLASGTTRTVLSEPDFLSLRIVVPSLEEQERILEQDKNDAIKKAGVDLDELNQKFRKDVHLMKHGMGQTVFNLGNWMKMLKYARKAGNGVVDDNAEIGGLVKVKVADIYDNIEASLKVLNRQLTTFDMGDSMEKSKMSLTDFIDKYIAEHPRPHVHYDFPSQQHRAESDVPMVNVDNSDPKNPKVMEYPGEYVVRKGEATDFIVFSEEALTIIFENIVSNAVAHGFSDPDKEYVIHIDFVPYGTSYVLTISNNGDPLPAGKDPSEVFIWGKTNGGKEHAGIGGYQVKDLMEHFEGKAEIISTPGQEFTVTYKLTFTKTNLLDANL
jgi:type I restriction-modification system DNA methylase subunit